MKKILIALVAALSATAVMAQGAPKAEAPAKPFTYVPQLYDITIGKKNAPVTLVEYASLSCPHCAHFYNDILPEFSAKYIDTGKVRLVYRHYPLNAPALKAATLVECADKDRQHDFLTVLFKMQDKWAYVPTYMDSLANIAALGGIGKERFDACMNDKSIEKTIVSGEQEASTVYKVNSTPTFFVVGSGAAGTSDPDVMKKSVDAALTTAGKR